MPALVPPGGFPPGHLVDVHLPLLDEVLVDDEGEVNDYTRLIPEDRLPMIRKAIGARLNRPASLAEVDAVVEEIWASLKKSSSDIESADARKGAMKWALEGFSAAVLWDAVRRAWRDRKIEWVPTSGVMFGICSDVERESRARLRVVDRMAAEHDRRRREEEVVERETKFWAGVVAVIGDAYAANDGAVLADRLWSWRQNDWPVMWPLPAAAGETWAVLLGRKLSTVARAVKAHENGLAGFGHVVAVARLAVHDETGALRAVEAIENGKAVALPTEPDATGANLEAALRDIGTACGGVVLHTAGAQRGLERPGVREPISVAEIAARKAALAELRNYRLAEPDEPGVQRRLREMSTAPTDRARAPPGETASIQCGGRDCPR